MADFYMYIGLPGSGKSTIAAAQKGATIISSDAIRGELYGDENILGKHNEVFGIMLRRTREALTKGETVCYDATNLTSRRRRGLLEQLPKGTKKHAIVVWARYSTCLKRNAERERKVEPEAIRRMLTQFDVPYYDEGWDDITILKNDEKGYEPLELLELLDIPHDNPHHDGSIIEHVHRVQRAAHALLYAEDNSRFPDEDTKNLVYLILRSVATWHDVGKPFVKSFFNTKQEFTPKEAHYYGHANVSTYLYLGIEGVDATNIDVDLCTAYLINIHMLKFEKEGRRYKSLPTNIKILLDFFNECDIAGA